MNKKKKAFVLPSTIISILVISLLSFLMMSMVITTVLSNKTFINTSNAKLKAENVLFVFKNQKTEQGDFDGSASLNIDGIETETYTNGDISAVVAKINEKELCFAVYNFDTKQVLCYQTGNYTYEINENILTFNELNLVKNV